MAETTEISWCDSTFNPWIGCTKVGPGCDNCYAEAWDRRFAVSGHDMHWGVGKARRRTSAANWKKPLQWNNIRFFECRHCGHRGPAIPVSGLSPQDQSLAACPCCAIAPMQPARRRVFCASLADVFDNEVPDRWRWNLLRLIADTPNLDWLLLTKRIGNARDMLNSAASAACNDFVGAKTWDENPLPNVWLGATVVNQAEAERDIPKLLDTRARVRFLSIEPMLGDIRLGSCLQLSPSQATIDGRVTKDMPAWTRIGSTAIDWVIVGGESGPNARPMHPDWVRSIRDQCAAARVPFLFKQWGEYNYDYDRDRDDPDWRNLYTVARQPGQWINLDGGQGFHGKRLHYACRVGKKAGGRLLDGRTHNEYPP